MAQKVPPPVNRTTNPDEVKETIRTYYDGLLQQGITARAYEKIEA